jgi:hypothetical protein
VGEEIGEKINVIGSPMSRTRYFRTFATKRVNIIQVQVVDVVLLLLTDPGLGTNNTPELQNIVLYLLNVDRC